MEETILFKPSKEIDDVKVKHLRVLKVLVRELGERRGRVDYGAVAAELRIDWNDVRYAVQALVKAGVLDKSDGMLAVIKKVVY